MERDDLESIECILSWRNVKARSIGVSKTDQELLRMHEKVLKSEKKIQIVEEVTFFCG